MNMIDEVDYKCWKEGCRQCTCYLLKSTGIFVYSCIDHFHEYWESNIYGKYKLIGCIRTAYPDSKHKKAQILFRSIQQLAIFKENLIQKITSQIEELSTQLSNAIFEINKEILERKRNLELIMKIEDKCKCLTDDCNIFFSKPLSFLRPLWKLNEINKPINLFSEKHDNKFIHIKGPQAIKMLDLDNFNLEEHKIELNLEHVRCNSFTMQNKNIGILAYRQSNQVSLYKFNWGKNSIKFLFSMDIMDCSCAVYYDGCVYLIGGYSKTKVNIYSQYNLKAKTKHYLPIMNKSSYFRDCTCFFGKLLLTGYDLDKLYIYDTMIDNYLPVLNLSENKFKFLCQSNSHAYVIEGRGNLYETENLFNWLKLGSTVIPNYDFKKSWGFHKNSIYFLQSNCILYRFDLKSKTISQERRINL